MSAWADHVMARDLDALADLREQQNHIEGKIREQVAYLRQQETPWQVIGDHLGVTKQAAQQRYKSTRTSAVDRPLA